MITRKTFKLSEKIGFKTKPQQFQKFRFAGDATETVFYLPNGWKPFMVFDGGLLVLEGSNDEYEVLYDGYSYSVNFGIAPANLNDVVVVAEKV